MCNKAFNEGLPHSKFHENDELSPLLSYLVHDLERILNGINPSENFHKECNKSNPYSDIRLFIKGNYDIQSRNPHGQQIDLIFSDLIPGIFINNNKIEIKERTRHVLDMINDICKVYASGRNFRGLGISVILASATYNRVENVSRLLNNDNQLT